MRLDNYTISVISCLVATLSFIFLGIIAFFTLKHTAKPRLKVKLKGIKKIQGSYWMFSEKEIELKFHLLNVGHVYAKPAIVDMTLYVNFHPDFYPYSLKFGSVLERETRKVLRGKKNSRYLVATDITLYNKEPGEFILVKIRAPRRSGIYPCWISARADHDDLGYHHFPIKVL